MTITALTAGIAIYAFRHRRQPGAATFGWLTIGMTLWSFLYALEMLAPTLSGKILAGKLEYIGFTTTPVLWFVFALKYTGHKDWLTPFRRNVLISFRRVTLGLALTNEFPSLI